MTTDFKNETSQPVGTGDLVQRVCETCDNWSRERMRCDYEPLEPCPPECSCDSWTAIDPLPGTVEYDEETELMQEAADAMRNTPLLSLNLLLGPSATHDKKL